MSVVAQRTRGHGGCLSVVCPRCSISQGRNTEISGWKRDSRPDSTVFRGQGHDMRFSFQSRSCNFLRLKLFTGFYFDASVNAVFVKEAVGRM
ncbi:hypothetical protein E2C01_078062 [Portunus trituberculatus]|uniref:Uncharacterized protein n=1 Tax=Portunus trituberculatus TaxID=210409 RepID=A0A5B7ILN7_PORTR|nr:hypothetical protein [Portunus trituberculatus]